MNQKKKPVVKWLRGIEIDLPSCPMPMAQQQMIGERVDGFRPQRKLDVAEYAKLMRSLEVRGPVAVLRGGVPQAYQHRYGASLV